MKKYYRIKSLEFEAIQCSYPDIVENLDKVEKFLFDTKYLPVILPDKTMIIINEEISEPIGKCRYFNYIVKDENKNVYVYSAVQFKELFVALDDIKYDKVIEFSREHLNFNIVVTIPYEDIMKLFSNIGLINQYAKNISKEVEYKIKKYFLENKL